MRLRFCIRIKLIFLVAFLGLWAYPSLGQMKSVTISGLVKDKADETALGYVNVVLKTEKDSAFVTGTVSNEEGRFTLTNIKPDKYFLELSFIGYLTKRQKLYVGSVSEFLDESTIYLEGNAKTLTEVVVSEKQDEVSAKMDKKTFSVDDNISQSGGSVLQTMQNLPGVTVNDGKVQLRGNEKVTVLMDGKQTALTGFGSQSGLDNIPASAIEKIEIIQNPSSKYDANGNAGIINIVMKKNVEHGFNGKAAFTAGLGALWVRQDNLPEMRPQYQNTPKLNPALALNYRKNKVNVFLQVDDLYTETLNKNEFVTRTYNDGTVIHHQLKRNRNTNFFTSKVGVDWSMNSNNTVTISGLYGSEKIIDRGDQPFFNGDYSRRLRFWQFLEDELKTTVMATASYQHKFKQAGRLLNVGLNYTFHREDEKYYYDNFVPTGNGTDAFKLISDEQVYDFNFDYIKPLKYGRLETGLKFRNRIIPTDMNFIPGLNSVLDSNAGGWATYSELIPAAYGNYAFEKNRWESELGLRIEYVQIQYNVNPNHNTYASDGYYYTQPFPNARLTYKLSERNKLSLFYNRRVDRPNEVDIRIFPKYDDAEIIKVGNPALRPQFTNSFEVGCKASWNKGYLYYAAYHKIVDGTITRISIVAPPSTLIYAVFQNAGRSYQSGLEVVLAHELAKWYSFNLNLNGFQRNIDAFSVENKYPVPITFSAARQDMISGNIKWNNTFHLTSSMDAQLTAIYLAPDIIPQGKIAERFSLDAGLKKRVQKGNGEFVFNATDLLNSMTTKKEIQGHGFKYISTDYYETQVVRLGYNYKF